MRQIPTKAGLAGRRRWPGALIKLREGDVARFVSPLGERELEVVEVLYQSLDMPGFDPEA